MCGIFGHVGTGRSLEKCLSGLRFLEYRGYDSSGIAGISNGQLFCFKEAGKLKNLEQVLSNDSSFCCSIGHTRWATHGEATKLNAHPHLDQSGSLALVHNGILENHSKLRSMLEKKGVSFQTDTDTEVIAQLIGYLYRGDLMLATQKALTLMKGFWALALIHKDHPNKILVTRNENPIVIGLSKKKTEVFLSSDPYAFEEKDLDLFYLKNFELAMISKEEVRIFDQNALEIPAISEEIDLPDVEIDKGDFAHFMLKEIFEQPEAVQRSIHGRFVLREGNAEIDSFYPKKGEFSSVLILGCGSSWHAGEIAALQIEALSSLPTRCEIASEYRYKDAPLDPKTLVIALSQSGETFDTIAAVRKCKEVGNFILAICNVVGSTLMREADACVPLRAGIEMSVCSTKAFNCQLAVLSLIALKLGRLEKMGVEEGISFLNEILSLPRHIEAVLEEEEALVHLARKYANLPSFFFIGRQHMFPTSLEAALKLKEISYINASAYTAGELKHGPIALIDSNCLVVGMCGNQKTYEKTLSNLMEVKARKAQILSFAPIGAKHIDSASDDVFFLPKVSDLLAPILYSTAGQLFAYYVAKERGTDIDQPRNLAKSVTVE